MSSDSSDGDARGWTSADSRCSAELGRLGRALAWSSDAVVLCDSLGLPSYVNPAFSRRFGYALRECVEAGGLAALFGQDGAWPELARVLRDESGFDGEFELVARDGAPVRTRVRADRIFEDADASDFVLLMSEVRGPSESEVLVFQSTHLIGRMAAGIAHEFGNVFNVVGLEARLIREATDPHDSRAELAQRIIDAAKHGGRLVRQLRVLGGRRTSEVAVLDLDEVSRATLALLEPFLGKRIELEFRSGAADPRVRADRAQLEHVIVSLAIRARDSLCDGGRLAVSVTEVEVTGTSASPVAAARPGRYVLLEMTHARTASDDASTEVTSRSSVPNEGAEDENLRVQAIFSIVRRNRGVVDVTTTTDGGSTVRILLPALGGQDVDVSPAIPFLDLPCGTEGVLLVQKSAYTSDLLRQMLEQKGYAVHVARSTHEALARRDQLGAALAAIVVSLDQDDGDASSVVRELRDGPHDLAVLCLDERSDAPRATTLERGSRELRLVRPIRAQDVLVGLRAVLDGPATGHPAVPIRRAP